MDIIIIIAGIILGTGIFFAINTIMDITYFGCGAIVSMWFGCTIFSVVVIALLGEIFLWCLKWIIIGGIIIGGIVMINKAIKSQ
ncbi:hypothetical protein [Paraclostridium sordellii]|uniref:hypothetical protein n=2 Tax=Peptostreptococcaceae TaxID=186804 RepID=UPI0005DD18E5|nr:hypothetical protein [Paeniclostridium sordellii]CEP85335.1 Uncharacterised protein [[Clostridium] sordellii] [Paeniclostridium sordellii]